MSDLLELLEKLFKGQIPSILLWVLLGLLLLVAFLRAIPFLSRELIPIFYSREKARKRNRRQRFAEHVEHEQRLLNSKEDWEDYRFTELEAEVEAEGNRRQRLLPFLVKRDNLRREPSLSRALGNSRERLILLEGMPGSGKSVALRHVALMMSRQAMHSRSLKTVIPVYVNLKTLKRRAEPEPVEAIDAELIRRFVLQSLNRANDRDVTAFLDDEFQAGLSDGTWFFLFDSFDEIPEILGSTEADIVIVQYAEAIHDFLHGMNRCRGIIASREYRGPSYLSWPRFRIMPLTSRQQQALVRRSGLSAEDETKTLGGLLSSLPSARHFIENPMFLGLLCAYVQAHHSYPEHESSVFEAYIAGRLARDQERLRQRFDGLSITDIREGAENIAFCMLTDSRLGLSATWQDIAESLSNQGLLPSVDVNRILDALHYTKLGKLESDLASGSRQVFTFTHRRLQEHLATTLLLREPERVPPSELLTNGVWRESAVVLLQLTESPEALTPIIATSIALLVEKLKLPPFNFEPQDEQPDELQDEVPQLPQPFPWPPGMLHIMDLLQSGLGGRTQLVPDVLRSIYTFIVSVAWNPRKWLLSDMQEALSVSGLASQDYMKALLSEALTHNSRRIRGVAYQQATFLDVLEPLHIEAICAWLAVMAKQGRMHREETAIKAYLLRLGQSGYLLDVFRFLKAIPGLSLVLGIAVIALIWIHFHVSYSFPLFMLVSFTLLLPFLVRLLIWNRYRTVLFAISVSCACLLLLALAFQTEPYSLDYFYMLYVIFLSYFYANFWQDYAYMRLDYSSKLIKPYGWPVVLLLPLISIPLSLARKGFPVVSNWFSARFSEIKQLRTEHRLVPVLIGFIIILTLGVAFIWLMFSGRLPTFVEMGITIIPMIGFLIVSIRELLSLARSSIRARRLFKATEKSLSKVSPPEYLQVVCDYSDTESDFLVRYTRLMRERRLVDTSSNDWSLLEKLSSQLQHDLLVQHEGMKPVSSLEDRMGGEDRFVLWYISLLKRRKQRLTTRWGFVAPARAQLSYGISFLGWEMLDELYLLLAQARDMPSVLKNHVPSSTV
ncbi:MAG: NACHT domain-containing protein [Anaerolineae bacterium]|nr:NACHT domain-containing protein [Anaerolineae bacterium]